MKEDSLNNTSSNSLVDLVNDLIASGKEGSYWDFKLEWHHDNGDLVHDVICLANNPEARRAYLIFGVDDESYQIVGINENASKRKNTQQLIDTLHSAIWAETYPRVEVTTVHLACRNIDIITIDPDRHILPYFLIKDFGRGKQTVRAGAIYSRSQDVNVGKNETAPALVAERLWRNRFGLDKTPLQRFACLMSNPEKWEKTSPSCIHDDIAFASCFYHRDYPEFTIARTPDEDRDAYEYFMLASPYFREPSWWTTRFYYHQTMLREIHGAYSDHLYIPIPTASMLSSPRSEWSDGWLPPNYGFYCQDSIEIKMLEFDLGKEGHSLAWVRDRLLRMIPVFRSEEERTGFESWLCSEWDRFRCSWDVQDTVFPELKNDYGKDLVRQAKMSATIVDFLTEYRSLA